MLVRFIFITVLPVLVSVLVHLLCRYAAFRRLSNWKKQLTLGIVFGALAVVETELGVYSGDVVVDVRDAAPLCAGLIFGGPAGVLAGVIGGLWRWFTTLSGTGAYTRVACAVSTVLAGCLAAVLRKYLFDNRKFNLNCGLIATFVTEVFCMLMIFLTNMADVYHAFEVVEKCLGPVLLMNTISVALAMMVSRWLEKNGGSTPKTRRSIAQIFQKRLLICVTVAFITNILFMIVLQTRLAENNATELMRLHISDVQADIRAASDENMLLLTRLIAEDLSRQDELDMATLVLLEKKYNVSEINVIDTKGFIVLSTVREFIGFDMRSGRQSGEFLSLLSGKKEMVQEYQSISYDQAIFRKYAGVSLEKHGGFVQVGYDAHMFHRDIAEQIKGITQNRHVGQSGNIIICDQNWLITSEQDGRNNQYMLQTGLVIKTKVLPENTLFRQTVYGEDCYCMYVCSEGYYIVAIQPAREVMFSRDISVYITAFMEVLVFALLFFVIYFLIKKRIVKNLRKINGALGEIASGNLEVSVDVRTNEEFSLLSDDINSTVDTLKRYIADAAARLDRELEFSKVIQKSALPSVFPPYPNRQEFDIFAEMVPAKEVGGDFYDFYLLDDHTLAFLIADVSGKGISAAMFMMSVKTIMKALTETGADVDTIFTKANEKLCENNEAGMFVTAWMGMLDLNTGYVRYANAGHCPPAICHSGGEFGYLRCRPGLMLAGMQGVEYRKYELTLKRGDRIYLYTDGVTDAGADPENAFGEDKLLKVLNRGDSDSAQTLCRKVHDAVNTHAAGAPQFDDITMLAITYWGPNGPIDKNK